MTQDETVKQTSESCHDLFVKALEITIYFMLYVNSFIRRIQSYLPLPVRKSFGQFCSSKLRKLSRQLSGKVFYNYLIETFVGRIRSVYWR